MEKIKLIFITTLIFICLLSANTFATFNSNMTYEDADYMFNYAMTNNISTTYNLPNMTKFTPKCIETTYYESATKTIYKTSVAKTYNNDTVKNNFVDAFNSANAEYNLKLDIRKYMFVFYTNTNYSTNWQSTDSIVILCIPVNNGMSNELPYPVIYYNQYPESSWGIGQLTLDYLATDNNDTEGVYSRLLTSTERENISQKPFTITIDNTNKCTYAINDWKQKKFRIITNENYRQLLYNAENASSTVTIDDRAFMTLNIVYPINQIVNYIVAPKDLTISKSSYDKDTFNFYSIKSWGRTATTTTDPTDPDTPSKDTNTGTITNSSGESTGKIDLSEIENRNKRNKSKIRRY